MASRNGGLSPSLVIDMSALIEGTVQLDDRLDRAVAGAVKFRGTTAESWMRTNAPWTDRTGNARSGLRTTTEHEAKKRHAINLFYSVSYGIWLEVRHSGKYAVILPALRDQGPKLMKTLNKVMARLGGSS